MKLELEVNGTAEQVEVEPAEVLLDTLRQKLHLPGTKDGCREGECGACTVLIDGDPVAACLFPAAHADGRSVTSIEGIGRDELSRLQRALLTRGGIQCGFCTPGVVMVLTALLRRDSKPTADDIKRALAGNLCRCTGYAAMVAAALDAARQP